MKTLYSWTDRSLESIYDRAEVIKTFALSKIWFRAQILPMPNVWGRKFESAIAEYLWKGQQVKYILPMVTVCLPLDKGGLGLPWLSAKCDALLLKQMLRILASTKSCFDHITF